VGAIDIDARPREFRERIGAVIVATGMVPYDAAALAELGYGRSPDIITGLEFEILYGPRGPVKGDILRPSDGKRPATVAILTCVGSRDEKHRPYCCQVGCMNALNQAYTVKERLGEGAEVGNDLVGLLGNDRFALLESGFQQGLRNGEIPAGGEHREVVQFKTDLKAAVPADVYDKIIKRFEARMHQHMGKHRGAGLHQDVLPGVTGGDFGGGHVPDGRGCGGEVFLAHRQ
jgi:hypothetical protein